MILIPFYTNYNLYSVLQISDRMFIRRMISEQLLIKVTQLVQAQWNAIIVLIANGKRRGGHTSRDLGVCEVHLGMSSLEFLEGLTIAVMKRADTDRILSHLHLLHFIRGGFAHLLGIMLVE